MPINYSQITGNSKKKEQILPVLLQMQNFYEPNSEFGMAMKRRYPSFLHTKTEIWGSILFKVLYSKSSEVCRWESGFETGRLYKVYQ